MTKKRILIAGPLPPPHSGQEMMTQALLATNSCYEGFEIIPCDTSNKRSNAERGRWDFVNLVTTAKIFFRWLICLVRWRPHIAAIPIQRNTPGFLKHALLIGTAKLFGAKIVSRLGGENFDLFYQQSSGWMKTIIRKTLAQITVLTVEADRLRQAFQDLFPLERCQTVPIAIEPAPFDEALKQRPRTFVKTMAPHILFLGHISKAKGALDLLQAIPAVVEQFPEAEFCFFGDILRAETNITHIANPLNMAEAVEELLKDPVISAHTHLGGIVKGRQKLASLLKATLFVLPSYSEGFSFAVLEAMAAGLPIITTPVGAMPEFLHEPANALFVPAGEPERLAQAICKILADPSLQSQMSVHNRQLVHDQFTCEHFSQKMAEVYKNVLA